MADQLCTPEDLASALQSDLDLATATLWIEAATAVVQQAAGNQRIVRVTDDTVNLTGLTSPWLDLPQIPAVSVASVTLDGTALTAVSAGGSVYGYRLRGDRLWRTNGWQTYVGEPSEVIPVYTHGYAAGSQDLQLGRGAVISISKVAYVNPRGAVSEKIDDYAVAYEKAAVAMQAMPNLAAALRNKYGRRGGFARLG